MGQAKIQLTVGSVSFSGEGEQEWLEKQLHHILEAVPWLAKIETPSLVGEADIKLPKSDGAKAPFDQSLASYIREKNGDSSQLQRFLVTADWLRKRGDTSIKTGTVTAALKTNQQKRLSNPSDCLNKNVSQGFCEKNGAVFFITPDGLNALGNS